MSPLELRHTIESGFLPLKTQTSIDDHQMLTVEVEIGPGNRFISQPVSIHSLNSSRAISNFIGSLRSDMARPRVQRSYR